MAKLKAEHVVVDAVAFFKNVQLQDVAESVHTLQAVVNEIRDKATRQRLSVLPYDIKFREPSSECIQIVSDFARKTGDYQSLSAVDIRVIALAYQLTKEIVGTDGLKKQPETKITYSASKKPIQNAKDIAGFYYPTSKNGPRDSNLQEDDDGTPGTPEDNSTAGDVKLELSDISSKDEEGVDKMEEGEGEEDERTCDEVTEEDREAGKDFDNEGGQREGEDNQEEETKMENMMDLRTDQCKDEDITEPSIDQKTPIDEAKDANIGDLNIDEDDGEVIEEDDIEEEDEDDDEMGWITPQNISQVREQMGGSGETSLEGIRVGCMTTDFAMQNVLIQIGIPVISVNGMLIKHAKSFVLRCHDCFKVTHDMGKVFCPKCGNKSLDKVTMTIDEDGTRRYHMSRRRPVNTRGLRYALPKPQGGKHASNPVLYPDQRIPQNRDARRGQKKTNVFDPDFDAMSSPFATHDVTSRSAQVGVRQIRGQGTGGRRNPNENRRQSKKGKRR
ncbi:RNA-binding protein NOB1-like [Lytechinus pictus]|uniref:RNA-binding protein NOB1-like n=1 Tax=Lytechinus pictus TaxID=7653 RepID=UPI0030B9B8D1